MLAYLIKEFLYLHRRSGAFGGHLVARWHLMLNHLISLLSCEVLPRHSTQGLSGVMASLLLCMLSHKAKQDVEAENTCSCSNLFWSLA
jgi:hypothetical protein